MKKYRTFFLINPFKGLNKNEHDKFMDIIFQLQKKINLSFIIFSKTNDEERRKII
jgi:hypothetical protein